MYKIEHFLQKYCEGDWRCSDDDDDYINNCATYSIWQFNPWRRWQSVKKLFNSSEYLSFCHPEWFALCYWMCLVISLGGIYYSIRELLRIYYGTWTLKINEEKEELKVIPFVFRRNARIIGSAVMAKAWTGLFIGMTTVRPSLISTWIAIYSMTIFLDLILWIGVTLFVENKLDFRSCCKHLMPVGTLFLFRCIHGVFIRQIERRANIEELELISKFTKKW